jgi:excisionase family DNA binding protein
VAKLLTTTEVAEELFISKRRVQALIKAGRLPAKKVGRDWLIKRTDLDLVADRRPGRPRLDNGW